MFGKHRNLIVSLILFFVSLITWQVTGGFAEKSNEMDSITSIAIYSFLATALFLFISLVLLVKTIISKSNV